MKIDDYGWYIWKPRVKFTGDNLQRCLLINRTILFLHHGNPCGSLLATFHQQRYTLFYRDPQRKLQEKTFLLDQLTADIIKNYITQYGTTKL